MKKAQLIVVFNFLLSTVLFGQAIPKGNHKLEKRTSPEIPFLKKFEYSKSDFGKDGETWLFTQIPNKAFAITEVDKKFKTKTSSKTFKELGFLNEAYHVLTLKNEAGLFALIMEYDKPNKKCILNSFKIDIDGNDWEKASTLFTLKAITSRPVNMGYDVRDYFEECYSADKNQLLVKYTYPPEDKINSRNKSVVGYALLDLSGVPKAIWNKDIRMPYTESRITFNGMTLDNKGRVFEQIIVKSEDKDDRKQGLNSAEIIYIDPEAGEAKTIGINGGEKGYMFKTNLTRDGKGRAVITGCSKSQLEGDAEKLFLAYLNEEEMSFSTFKYVEIPKSIYSQKSISEKSKGPFFELKSFYFNKKGETYILGRLIDEWKYALNYTRLWYGNYLIFKVDPLGELEWNKVVPYESASTYSIDIKDYFFDELDGQLYFGYEIDESKSVLSKNQKTWDQAKWASYFVKVNSDGNFTKNKTGFTAGVPPVPYFNTKTDFGKVYDVDVLKASFKTSITEMKE